MKFQYIYLGLVLGCGWVLPVQAKPAEPLPALKQIQKKPQEALDEASTNAREDLINEVQIQAVESGSYLSSQFARSSGDIEGAIVYLRKVYAKNPKNMGVANELMGLQLLSGDVDGAYAMAKIIHAAGANDPVPALLMTLSYIKDKKLEQASQLLSSDFPDGRGQLWLPLVEGWVNAGQGKLKKPMNVEELETNVGRAVPIVNYHLALINNAAGFKDAAAQNFSEAVGGEQNPPARIMKMLMAFYEENKKPATLSPIISEYKKANPDATPASRLVRTPQEGVGEVLFTMGSIMQAAGLVQDSIIYFQMACYLKNDFWIARMALGESYAQLKLYKQAAEMFSKIPSESDFYAKAQLNIAVGTERMGKLPQAMAMLDRLARELPEGREALVIKGDLYRRHKQYEQAIESYSQAIRKAGAWDGIWAAYFARGSSLERIGRWNEAEMDLRTALEMKPAQPDILNYLGFGLLTHAPGKREEAQKMIEHAVTLRPDDPAIVDSMGWALYLAGDYTGAVEFLEKAIELMPNDSSIYDHLGDAYWRLGRKTEARYQWERSLSYAPEAEIAEAVRQKIRDGLPPDPASAKAGDVAVKAELPRETMKQE